jgi:hypothetical protein
MALPPEASILCPAFIAKDLMSVTYTVTDLRTEALANLGQNWVLDGTDINQETGGFSTNEYGNEIRIWIDNNMELFLTNMGLVVQK